MSSPVDCRDAFDRQEMRDQAQFESGDDPVANLGAITMTATTGCTDTIAPGDSRMTTPTPPKTWNGCAAPGMPGLALLGIGNGAQIALAYAGSHPEKVARLILDSPSRRVSAPRRRPKSRSRGSRRRSTRSPHNASP